MNRSVIMILLGFALSCGAHATMYKWVDTKGKVHYGDTIPPEYANQGNAQLNDNGQVERKPDGVADHGGRAQAGIGRTHQRGDSLLWLCPARPPPADESGKARSHGGTQMLRLAAGDGATLISEPCKCGLTTPRLRGIRVTQVWMLKV